MIKLQILIAGLLTVITVSAISTPESSSAARQYVEGFPFYKTQKIMICASTLNVKEELKDFDFWKSWKNGEVELSTETPFQTKPGFVEKRIQQMIHIGADQEYEKYSEGMSDDDIQRWKHGFVCGANYAIGNN